EMPAARAPGTMSTTFTASTVAAPVFSGRRPVGGVAARGKARRRLRDLAQAGEPRFHRPLGAFVQGGELLDGFARVIAAAEARVLFFRPGPPGVFRGRAPAGRRRSRGPAGRGLDQ